MESKDKENSATDGEAVITPSWPRYKNENKRSAVNSGTFYFSDVAIRDWTAPENPSLWQDGIKNLFDPCPAGWRVPLCGDGDRSPWATFSEQNVSGPFNNGYAWGVTGSGQSGTAHYPAAGVRYHNSGKMYYTTTDGLYWSAYLYYYFRAAVKWVQPGSPNSPAHGFSVRCIRE